MVEKEGIKQKKKDLCTLCLNAKNFDDTKLKWVLKTSYDIHDEAMNDLLKGYSSNFAAKRKKFNMKFRSKKDSQQSITVLSKHLNLVVNIHFFLKSSHQSFFQKILNIIAALL